MLLMELSECTGVQKLRGGNFEHGLWLDLLHKQDKERQLNDELGFLYYTWHIFPFCGLVVTLFAVIANKSPVDLKENEVREHSK